MDESKKREFVERLGAILDRIDEEARLPGEPSLRSVIAAHARDELKELGNTAHQ